MSNTANKARCEKCGQTTQEISFNQAEKRWECKTPCEMFKCKHCQATGNWGDGVLCFKCLGKPIENFVIESKQ